MTSEQAAARVAEIVRNVESETGYGPTRDELAEIMNADPRSIPGVRLAIAANLVHYAEDRLVTGVSDA